MHPDGPDLFPPCFLNFPLLLGLRNTFTVNCSFSLWRRQWHPTPVLLPGKYHGRRSLVGCSPRGHEESDTTERLHFHALEKEMATRSSVLTWRIPGTVEPGGLPSMGSHRVRHNWSDLAAAAAPSLSKLLNFSVGKWHHYLRYSKINILNFSTFFTC